MSWALEDTQYVAAKYANPFSRQRSRTGLRFKVLQPGARLLGTYRGAKTRARKGHKFFHRYATKLRPRQIISSWDFLDERMSGLAELSFGFLKIGDLYFGFMMLGPCARNSEIGVKFLDHVEYISRQAGGQKLFLAVLSISPKGCALWERQGFSTTGVWRATTIGNKYVKIHRLVKQLYQS